MPRAAGRLMSVRSFVVELCRWPWYGSLFDLFFLFRFVVTGFFYICLFAVLNGWRRWRSVLQDPDYQRFGIGRALVQFAVSRLVAARHAYRSRIQPIATVATAG